MIYLINVEKRINGTLYYDATRICRSRMACNIFIDYRLNKNYRYLRRRNVEIVKSRWEEGERIISVTVTIKRYT